MAAVNQRVEPEQETRWTFLNKNIGSEIIYCTRRAGKASNIFPVESNLNLKFIYLEDDIFFRTNAIDTTCFIW